MSPFFDEMPHLDVAALREKSDPYPCICCREMLRRTGYYQLTNDAISRRCTVGRGAILRTEH
jgi:hypothetical protein